MKFSKYVIALICIVMILSVGAVSATEDIISTDDAGDSILSVDNSDNSVLSADSAGVVKYYVNSSVTISGDGSESSPFKTIGEAINVINVVNGTEIHLADGVYSSVGDRNFNGLYSIGNLSILGSGENTIIDLSQSGYFMNAYDYDSNLVMKDLTITNGFGSYNSIFTNMGILTLENVNIYNSRSNNPYGSSYLVQNVGEANIINCKFINNTARNGNVYVGGKAHVTDSTFINNVITSYTDGGALSCVGGEVINCVFNDNRAGDDRSGGAIYTSGDLNVTNCNFTNNMAPRYGGAISGASNKKLNVVNCTFTRNNAKVNGGAISLPASVENCKFINNTASQDGGAIYIQNGNIENNIFIGNTAYRTGAAIYAQGAPSLKNNTAQNCISQKDDFIYFSSLNNLKGITYVVLDNASLTIESVNVRLNASLFDGDGNPISGYTVTFLMNDEVVGTADSMFGTASLSFNKILNGTYVISVKLPNNECEVKTAILNISPLENIDVYISPEGDDEKGDGSENNPYKTADKGLTEATKAINGNLYVKNGVYNVTKSYDINSMGNFSIIAYEGNTTFNMCNKNCFASLKGNVSIYNVTFINGYSSASSTLKSLFSGETLKLVGCSFINNTCYQYLLGVNFVDIESCYFTNNDVQSLIYGNNGKITNSYVEDKKSKSNTIRVSGSVEFVIDNCEFDTAYIQIYSDIPLAKVTNSKFYNNKVNQNTMSTGANIEVDNCTFINQTRSSITVNTARADITNCTFINNTGTSTYAAIYYNSNYYDEHSTLYLSNNCVINSTSEYYVYLNGYISSPYTYVVLNNESIEVEAFGYKFTAIGYDDVSNKINFADVTFYANETNLGSASYDNDGAYLVYKKVLDGTYVVSAKSKYINDTFVKTATLKITPSNKELWVSVDGNDENNGSESYPFKTLDKAISEATGFNNIIHMADGNYNIQGSFAISTSGGTLTIVGSDNTVIDLNKASRFMTTDADSVVVLKNLDIVNGYATAAGGSILNRGTLTVDGVSFINSTSSGTQAARRGGAISNTAKLYVINSKFINCSATQAGAIYNTNYLYLENNAAENVVARSGTGNYVLTTGVVDGVTLEFNNNATYDITDSSVALNVIVSDNGNLITGSGTTANLLITFLFNGNEVGTSYLGNGEASLTINKKFDGQYILSGNLGGAENQNIKTATFNYNISGLKHEVWVSKENGDDNNGDGSKENPYATIDKALTNVYDDDSTIHVLKGNYEFTQMITISSVLSIIGEEEGVVFDGSMSKFFNIEKLSGLTIKNVTFANAKSNQMIANRGSLTIDNCIFENNTGSSYQFLIYSMEGELNLFNSIFRNNTVSISGSSTGVLIWQNGEAKIINTTFYNNTVNTQSALIYLQNGQYYDASWNSYWTNTGAYIENCKFEDNLASILSLEYIDVPITDSVFSNNTGRYIIYLGGSNNAIKRVLNISNSNFTDNTVDEGIIELQNYVADIQNNIFTNNTGCIGLSTGANNHEYIIANNTISNNSANEYGNYMYINNYATITGSTLKLIFNNNITNIVQSFELPLNATLVDQDGNQINGIWVTFNLDGNNAGQAQIINGVADILRFASASGNYTVSGTPQIANTNMVEILNAVFEVKLVDNKVIYVDVFGDDTTGDGSEDNPYASLSRAFEDINAINTTIYIKPGVYSGELNYDKEINIPNGAYVEIIGLSEFGDNVVFKDLSNRFLGFYNKQGGFTYGAIFAVKNIIFKDSTFDNGFITGSSVNVLIDNISFVNATPRQLAVGGNEGFDITISNVAIDFNNATFTDSVPFILTTPPTNNGGNVKLVNTSFINGNFTNSRYFIYCGGICDVINSKFINMSVGSTRGYVINSWRSFNIDNSTFINNRAQYIFNGNNAISYIYNSTFDSNVATFVFAIGSNSIVSNCVILNTTRPDWFTGNTVIFSTSCTPSNNWFGNNNLTLNPNVVINNNAMAKWVIAEVIPSELTIKENSTITVKFLSNDGSELENVLPARVVEAVAGSAIFENGQNNISYTINGNEVTFTVLPDAFGTVNLTVDNQEFTLNIVKANTSVSAEDVEITYGDDLIINVTSSVKEAGNIIFLTVNNVTYNATTDASGVASFEIKDIMPVGNYTVEFIFKETEFYNPSNGTSNLTINKIVPVIYITADNVTVFDDLMIKVEVDGLGNVTVSVGNYKETKELFNDVAIFNAGKFAADDYTIEVTYGGDDTHETATDTKDVSISKVDSEINIEVENATVGTVTNVTVTVPNATGNVSVKVGTKSETKELSNSVAKFEIKDLAADDYTVEVSYAGDDNYNPSTAQENFTISKVTEYTINASTSDIKVGEDLIMKVSVPEDATGNVTVKIGNDTYTEAIKEGIAKFTIKDLTYGNYTAEVTYDGDAKYDKKETAQDFKVEKVADYNITAKASEIKKGEDLTLEVSVPSDASGNITVKVENGVYTEAIKEGKAVFTISDLNAGNYTAQIIYDGDAKYAKGETTKDFSVAKSDNYTVDIDAPIADVGKDAEITVTLPGDATGNVTVDINENTYSEEIKNGVAKFAIPDLVYGNYSYTVSYPGDDNYEAFSEDGNLSVVNRLDADINIDVESATVGTVTNITVTVTNATGKVRIEVGDYADSKELTDSSATFAVPDLTYGNYTVEAKYEGDLYFGPANATEDFTIEKVEEYDINIEVSEAKKGEDITITVTVPEDATGNITVVVEEGVFTEAIKDGKAVFTVPGLDAGDYIAEVSYDGDDKYVGFEESELFTVEKVDAEINISTEDGVNVELPEDAGGYILVDVNGTGYYAPVKDGTADVKIVGLEPGTYEATITYTGDDNYNSFETQGNVTVPEVELLDPELDIDINGTVITLSINENATGQVILSVGGLSFVFDASVLYPVDVSEYLSNGTYYVGVSYSGDDVFAADEIIGGIVVVPEEELLDPELEVSVLNTTIYVELNENATGVVIVSVGETSFVFEAEDAPYIIDVSDFAPDTYDVIVNYLGDDVFAPADANATVTVPEFVPEDAGLKVTVDDAVVTISLNENATGYVVVSVAGEDFYYEFDGEDIVVDLSDYEPGNYTVDVTYSGDEVFAVDNATATVTIPDVIPEDANVTIDINDSDVSVELPEDAEGYVVVSVDGKNYFFEAGDDIELDLSDLAPGEYPVTVTYSGDDKYAPAVANTTVTVPEIVPEDPELIATAENATITVTLNENATGNILVEVDGTGYFAEIEDGEAVIEVIGLEPGDYEAVVTYLGDEVFAPANATVTITVPKDEPVDPETDVEIGNDTISVELPEDATGYLLVDVDGKGYYAPVKDGKASVDLPELAPGNHTVTVTYTGDGKYASTSTTQNITVEPKETIISEDLTKVEKAPDKFEATFTDKNGNALANTKVTFEIQGGTYTRTTDANGKAAMAINLEAGNYTIKMTNPVTGEVKSNNITVVSRFQEANDLVKYFRNDTQYVIKVLGDDGNIAPVGTVVTFNINGVFYNRTVNATGHVKLNINLNPGEYIITGECKGCLVSNKVTVLPILTGEDLTKQYGVPGAYEVKLVDGQGKPYAGQSINLNINGVFYDRTTNSDGIAKLNINLMPGQYIITATYGYAAISNTVTVTA